MRLVGILIGGFLLVVALTGLGIAGDNAGSITAILGAFDAETELIKGAIVSQRDTTFLGITFTLGELRGRHVVLANAGIGKVNAAMTTTLLIEHLNPSEVLFTGIAGGLRPDLYPGDIVVAVSTAHHDFAVVTADTTTNMATRNPISGVRNPVFLAADTRLLGLAKQATGLTEFENIPLADNPRPPETVEGIVVTGDSFIASGPKKEELMRRLQADAVEMEGAAVAQICYQLDTPCLIIRSISDRADSSAVEDAEQFYQIAANNSASLVMTIVELLATEDHSR